MDAKEPKETKEQKETKNSVGAVQNYIVQPVMLPIAPVCGTYLPETFDIDAVYAVSTGQLTVLMSFMLPGGVNPSQVSIKQYYDSDPHESSELQFYAVYSSESTAQPKEVDCKFKACATGASGESIDLGAILSITTMLVNTVGPKTSRGIMSNVRTTED